MKSLLSFLAIFLIITIVFISNVNATEDISTMSESKNKNFEKFAEKFCIAKADHLFEGLENEKGLKYSYFRYIGSKEIDIRSNNIEKNLIRKIRERCNMGNEEERELLEFFKNELKDN